MEERERAWTYATPVAFRWFLLLRPNFPRNPQNKFPPSFCTPSPEIKENINEQHLVFPIRFGDEKKEALPKLSTPCQSHPVICTVGHTNTVDR